jgi:hypothetical protein
MNLSEAIYVDGVIEEALAGLGGLFGAAKRGMASVGQNVAKKARDAMDSTKDAYRGAKTAAGQVAGNVKDIYNAAEVAKAAEDAVFKATKNANALVELVKDAQKHNLISDNIDDVMVDMTLAEVISMLKKAARAADYYKYRANQEGFTRGMGDPFKNVDDPSSWNNQRSR